ncbi:MAG: GAF domain-containing protein [bacterium]
MSSADRAKTDKQKLKALEAENRKLRKRIDNLERKYQRQKSHAGLLKEMSSITSKSFKVEKFLDRIMDRVLEATGGEAATLFLADEQAYELEFAVVKGPSASALQGKRIPADEGIAGKVYTEGSTYLSSDVSRDEVWSPRVAKEIGHETRNMIAVPLKMGKKVTGVIEVINKKDGETFNRDDVAFIKSLATEAAVAINNANLHLETMERADQFATLSRLSSVLNSTLQAKEVRKRAMEAAVELLQCETGSLYLIDREKQELYFEVALGEKGDAVKEIRLKMGEGIAGWVAQEGKSDLVADTSVDPRWASKVDKKSKFQTRNMVTVPVKSKGEVIGVLQAINKLHGRKFTEDDQRMLENLADQVGIALENARLYEAQKVMFKETAQALAAAIEKRDPYTGGHTKRVRDFSMACAKYMKLDNDTMEWLEIAAILHDAGKIGVDDQILRKPSRLTDDEFWQMKQHPKYGFEILQHVKELGPAIPGMKYHHERFDGKGYPDGLEDGSIPVIARIIAAADTWDAMTSDRPYRKGLPDKVANQELRKFSGIQFDPEVVKAFLKAYRRGLIKSRRLPEKKTQTLG